MLDDILWNSDGFGVVDSLLLRSGIKDWWKKGQDGHRSTTTTTRTYTYDNLDHSPHNTLDPHILETLDAHLLETLESMSITRQLFNEFRPFFRMLDDAAFRPFAAHPGRAIRAHEDPFESFFGRGLGRAAKVEMKEQPNAYVIEAELPGVKKENLDVSVGDNGRSITIEGKVFARSADAQGEEATSREVVHQDGSGSTGAVMQQEAGATSSEVAPAQQQQEQWETRSSFSRTIWLPHAVDTQKVSGKLEDGVLRLEIPKLAEEESGRTKINVQ